MKGGKQRSGVVHTTLPAALFDSAPGISCEALVSQGLGFSCFRFRLLPWVPCGTLGLRQLFVWAFAVSQNQSDRMGLQTRLTRSAVLEWSPGAFWNLLKRWLLHYRRSWLLL